MSLIITGHQPVYLPWLGLFHKISLADIFIVMDDVQYLSQDWNNRNKIKTPNGWIWLTVPVSLKKSRSRLLKDIIIDSSKHGTKDDWQLLHWKNIEFNYKRAAFFSKYADFFYDMYIENKWEKLTEINIHQLKFFLDALGMKIKLYNASDLNFSQKKSDLVLEHCLKFNADICVTGYNAKDYIKRNDFEERGIKVYFQNYKHPVYSQMRGKFLPNMSVLDLLFNVGEDAAAVICKDNVLRQEIESA